MAGGIAPTEQADDFVDPTGDTDESDHEPPIVEVDGEHVDPQWHGPGAKVYRNYHTNLTGMLPKLRPLGHSPKPKLLLISYA